MRELDFFMSAYLHFNKKAYLLMNNTFGCLQLCFFWLPTSGMSRQTVPSPGSKASQCYLNLHRSASPISYFI